MSTAIRLLVCQLCFVLAAWPSVAQAAECYQNEGPAEIGPCPDQRVPRVAKGLYREHIFYRNLYTVPELYLANVPARPDAKRVLAIGDSWFAYPKGFLFFDVFQPPSNVLTNLETISRARSDGRLPLYILSLSNSGEILANMAGRATEDPVDIVEAVQVDVDVLETVGMVIRRMGEMHSLEFDYVLISGGGNDILSRARLKAILGYRVCATPDHPLDCIDGKAVERFLARLETSYRTLVAYVLDRNPSARVLAHTYDRIFPAPRGAKFFGGLYDKIGKGGWIHPMLMTYGITQPERQREIPDHLLREFSAMLCRVQESLKGQFVVVNTYGTIKTLSAGTTPRKPESHYWLNEIHLEPRGFEAIAEAFYAKLRMLSKLDPEPAGTRGRETITTLPEACPAEDRR